AKGGERGVVGEQSLAPLLGRAREGPFGAMAGGGGLERVTYRVRIGVAHQPADQLALSAQRLARAEAPAQFDGVAQLLVDRNRGELLGPQREERVAQALQLVRLALERTLAGAKVVVGHVVAGLARLRFGEIVGVARDLSAVAGHGGLRRGALIS